MVRTCSALCACGKASPSSSIFQPEPPEAPTVFAAKGGTVVAQAHAVGIRGLLLLGQPLGRDTDSPLSEGTFRKFSFVGSVSP